MSLGRFGGRGPIIEPPSSGSGLRGTGASLLTEESRDNMKTSAEGMPVTSPHMYLVSETLGASFGDNLLKGGSFPSFSGGDAAVADGWGSSGMTSGKETTDTKHGTTAVDLSPTLDSESYILQAVTVSATTNQDLRSSYVTFSIWMLAGAVSRAFLRIDDGVATKSSDFHLGDSTYRLISVSLLVNSAATKVECQVVISSGSVITITVDAAKLNRGLVATRFSEHSSDRYDEISNFNNSGTNNTEVGVFRSEIGTVNTSGTGTLTEVTWQTAFRTIRIVVFGWDVSKPRIAGYANLSATTMTVDGWDATPTLLLDTREAFGVRYRATGHV